LPHPPKAGAFERGHRDRETEKPWTGALIQFTAVFMPCL
jgi:hypothetical protein